MKLSVLQPGYFPAIDQIGKCLAADVVVWADTFQFHKHGNFNRTRIKTISGPAWLTIPVHSGRVAVNVIQIDNHSDWVQRHTRSIELNYKNAAYYPFYCDSLQALFTLPVDRLEPFLDSCLQWVWQKLAMENRLIKASALPQEADRNRRVVTWCQELNCDAYIMQNFETRLMDLAQMERNGITPLEYSLTTPYYFQQYTDFYFPLSILDMLFNEGDMTRQILSNNIKLFPMSQN